MRRILPTAFEFATTNIGLATNFPLPMIVRFPADECRASALSSDCPVEWHDQSNVMRVLVPDTATTFPMVRSYDSCKTAADRRHICTRPPELSDSA